MLWSHDNDVINPKRRYIKSNNKRGDSSIDSKDKAHDLESDKNAEKDEPNWKKESTAQIGYGEITKGAMQKFITLLQNIDKSFKPEHEKYLKFSKEEYNLTKDDTFIDIGSGFGKPVFHVALQVG